MSAARKRTSRAAMSAAFAADVERLARVAAEMEDRLCRLHESGAFEWDDDGGAEMEETIAEAQEVLARFGALILPTIKKIEPKPDEGERA